MMSPLGNVAGKWGKVSENRYKLSYYDPFKKKSGVKYLILNPELKSFYLEELPQVVYIKISD